MGLFNFLNKKEIKLQPGTNFFLDILKGTDSITISEGNGIVLDSYYNTPQLATIINYISKVAANNDLRYYNNSDEEQENELLNIFKNPHPLYSEGEFWESFFKQYELFNIVLTYKVAGIGGKTSGLFILPSQLIKILPIKDLKPIDILLAKDIKEIIRGYQLTFKGKKYFIDVNDVWMITGSSLKFDEDNYLIPDNIITSLQYPIKNIQANYEARYSLVDNRGQLGVWVNNQSDSGSYVPIESKEKDNIYKAIRKRFGMTRGRELSGFTNANIRFETASLPIKDLELSQGIQDDKVTLCDAFQFPILLLNELSGSTFSNMDTADRTLYTKKIIPLWEIISKSITREFLTDGYVKFYTNDIEVLKKDDKIQAETNKLNTDIIIKINNTSMGYEEKINTLVLISDLSEDIARQVITDKPNNNEKL